MNFSILFDINCSLNLINTTTAPAKNYIIMTGVSNFTITNWTTRFNSSVCGALIYTYSSASLNLVLPDYLNFNNSTLMFEFSINDLNLQGVPYNANLIGTMGPV